jgi:hypothetical protein
MLLQQQHQHTQQSAQSSQQRSQGVQLPFINVNQINRQLAQPGRPNSASGVLLTNPNANVTNSSNVTGGNPSPQQIPQQNFKVINPQGQILNPNNLNPNPSRSPSPTVRHQVLHIQRQQQIGNSLGAASTPAVSTANNFPVRAQIVTSNGETLTIHRASTVPINGPIRLNRAQYGTVNVGQMRRLPKNFIISNRSNLDGSQSNPNNRQLGQFQLIQSQVAGGVTNRVSVNTSTPSTSSSSSTVSIIRKQSSNQIALCETGQNNVRIISLSEQSLQSVTTQDIDGREMISNQAMDGGSLGNLGSSSVSSISNLAEFITNQLAASNMRPISPLTYDQNGMRLGERSSPNVFTIHSQDPSSSDQFRNVQNSPGPRKPTSEGVVLVMNSNGGINNSSSSSEASSISNSNNNNSMVNSSVISSSNQNSTNRYSQAHNPMADLINCTNEVIMDLQDVLASGVDSPYSLISEPEPPCIAEIIDVASNDSIATSGSSNFHSSVVGSLSNSSFDHSMEWGGSHCQNSQSAGLDSAQRNSQGIRNVPNGPYLMSVVPTSSSSSLNPGIPNNSLPVSSSSSHNQLIATSNSSPSRLDVPHPVVTSDGLESNKTVLVQVSCYKPLFPFSLSVL